MQLLRARHVNTHSELSPVILKTELRRPGCLFNFKIPTRDYGVWGTERKYKVKVKDPDTDTWGHPKYTQRATVRNLNSAAPGWLCHVAKLLRDGG